MGSSAPIQDVGRSKENYPHPKMRKSQITYKIIIFLDPTREGAETAGQPSNLNSKDEPLQRMDGTREQEVAAMPTGYGETITVPVIASYCWLFYHSKPPQKTVKLCSPKVIIGVTKNSDTILRGDL